MDDVVHVFGYPRDMLEHYTLGERIGENLVPLGGPHIGGLCRSNRMAFGALGSGSGSFGVVRICIEKSTGTKFAVKAIPKTPRNRKARRRLRPFACPGPPDKPPLLPFLQSSPKYLLKLQNEVDCMRQLGASLNAVYLQDVFEDDTHMYMVRGC